MSKAGDCIERIATEIAEKKAIALANVLGDLEFGRDDFPLSVVWPEYKVRLFQAVLLAQHTFDDAEHDALVANGDVQLDPLLARLQAGGRSMRLTGDAELAACLIALAREIAEKAPKPEDAAEIRKWTQDLGRRAKAALSGMVEQGAKNPALEKWLYLVIKEMKGTRPELFKKPESV